MENGIIPEYTAEDFYDTDEPYQFLYAFRNNAFLLKQMREKMKAQALSVGVRGFIGLWEAFLEMQHRANSAELNNVTQFDYEGIELMCGKYICNENGVMMSDKFGYEIVVCRHPILPIQRLINIDSGEERLKIAFKKGGRWRTIVVEKSVIASTAAIIGLSANGVMVNNENAKYLSTYLLEVEQMNYDSLQEQKSVGRLGWTIDGQFAPYVDGIEFDGEANFSHIFNAVKCNGDYYRWKKAMIDMRAEKGTGRLFLAASFASVLLEPCGLLPFFLHAWGGTEVGKTVGLMIAASVWANPKLGDYCTTFNSTSVGQEMQASFLNSLPLCMDELQIQSTAGIKDFDKIIYQLTEGVGRTRGAKTGGLQRQNKWRCCFITNGEQPISMANSGGGAVNRIIEFEVTEKVCKDLVGICEVINENYGWAGREFIEFLKVEGNIEKAKQIQRNFYNELLESDSTDKQAASAAAILTADFLATKVIFQDENGLTVEDMQAIMTSKDEVDVNKRALDFLYEMVAQNYSKFHKNEYGDWNECWGFKRSGYIYILKKAIDEQFANAGFNTSAFLSWAQRRGILLHDNKRRTKNVSFLGQTVRMVVVKNINEEEKDFEEIEI